MAEFLTLRPEVQEFAQAIEARLRKNDDKDGWQHMRFQECIDRSDEERDELERAIQHPFENASLKKIQHEIEDTVNFLLFAWHNAEQEFEL